MRVNKRAVTEKTIETYVLVMVLVLVLFKVIADVFPDVTAAAGDLNSSGFPLAEFFLADGALWYLVAAALLFLVYKAFRQNK
jgi:hypothetical protein